MLDIIYSGHPLIQQQFSKHIKRMVPSPASPACVPACGVKRSGLQQAVVAAAQQLVQVSQPQLQSQTAPQQLPLMVVQPYALADSYSEAQLQAQRIRLVIYQSSPNR
jgi:hypothetical protein